MRVGRMWGNRSYTTCGCSDSVEVLLGLRFFCSAWLVLRWGISKGRGTAETKLHLYRSCTHLGWLRSSTVYALHRWAVSMDSASWIMSEKSEVLSWETWNPPGHVFFIETQLLQRGNGEELFSWGQSGTTFCSFQEWERAQKLLWWAQAQNRGMLLGAETKMRFWFPYLLPAFW